MHQNALSHSTHTVFSTKKLAETKWRNSITLCSLLATAQWKDNSIGLLRTPGQPTGATTDIFWCQHERTTVVWWPTQLTFWCRISLEILIIFRNFPRHNNKKFIRFIIVLLQEFSLFQHWTKKRINFIIIFFFLFFNLKVSRVFKKSEK